MNKRLLRAGLLVSTLAVCDSALAATDIYNITAQEHAACDGDAVRLCMAAYPDAQKLLSCMASHRAQLNPICLAAFDTGLKRRHLHVPDLSASAQ